MTATPTRRRRRLRRVFKIALALAALAGVTMIVIPMTACLPCSGAASWAPSPWSRSASYGAG